MTPENPLAWDERMAALPEPCVVIQFPQREIEGEE